MKLLIGNCSRGQAKPSPIFTGMTTASMLHRQQTCSWARREVVSLRILWWAPSWCQHAKDNPQAPLPKQGGVQNPSPMRALSAAQQIGRQPAQEMLLRAWRQQVPGLMSSSGAPGTCQQEQSTWGQTGVWIDSGQPGIPDARLHQPQDGREHERSTQHSFPEAKVKDQEPRTKTLSALQMEA